MSETSFFSSPCKAGAIAIDVEHVSKGFGNRMVLEDVNIHVSPGEIFVLMGPSGSGKSVFLSLLAGLSQVSGGQIYFNRENLQQVKRKQRYVIALVFQSGALFNSLTVFDNLALYLREHRMYGASEIEQRVLRMLEMLALKEVAFVRPSELSGGMRKRVALARGLLMEPDVLLFDEPTSELDPVTAASIIELIGYVNRQTHITTFIVSHDVMLAQSIGNHIALLQSGHIQELYTAQTLVQSTHPFVRNFLQPTINLNQPKFLSALS